MTTEEKLEKATEFIKLFEQMAFPIVTTNDIIDDAHGCCVECGDWCDIDYDGPCVNYVEATAIDEMKDKAWHLLADLAE